MIPRRPYLNSAKNKLNYVRQGFGNGQIITVFARGGGGGGGGWGGFWAQISPRVSD